MVVVGGIIGAGIFINPYIVAQRLPTSALVLAAWVAGGIIAMAGAFTFAELGSMFPKVGGHYAYLRDAYHPLAGFLYGWALLLMIETGAIAAVAITFAQYALRLVGRPETYATHLAIVSILIVTIVNYLGIKPGSRVLNIFVVLKTAALVVLILAGLLLLPGTETADSESPLPPAVAEALDTAEDAVVGAAEAATGAIDTAVEATAEAAEGAGLVTRADTQETESHSPFRIFVAFGAALIAVMFSYGGWQNANFVAEEIKNPKRNLPLSIVAGTAVVVAVYVSVNYVYLRALGHAGLAGTMTPAADASRFVMGEWGDTFITAAIAISTFGFLNLTVLAPTRVYYAMAADGVFFSSVARLHPRYRTPSLAIVIQSTWAILLVLTGRYADLVDYVIFADQLFFALAGASLFVFRFTHPLEDRPEGTYKSPGYPFVPALFVVAATFVVMSVLWSNPVRSGLGLLLLAVGVPAFYYWNSRKEITSP
jgi:APA family basic amino acid/polyamine antiporter